MIAWIVIIGLIVGALVLFTEFAVLCLVLLTVGALVSTETVIGNVAAVAVVGGLIWFKTMSEGS